MSAPSETSAPDVRSRKPEPRSWTACSRLPPGPPTPWRPPSRRQRAAWLEAVADALDARAETLVPLAAEESHLAADPRLKGELKRTTFQLRLFAELLTDGSWLAATVDHADADWPMGARPDIRRMQTAIGPVLVFAASNFPFAFSVAGGDTASALAAGCPVVVKAHPGHPRLSDQVAEVVAKALSDGRRAGGDLRPHPRAGRRRHRAPGPADPGRVVHRVGQGRPGTVRHRLLTAPPDPVLRRAGQHQPGGRDGGGGRRASRGDRHRVRHVIHHGCGAVLHQAGPGLPAREPRPGRRAARGRDGRPGTAAAQREDRRRLRVPSAGAARQRRAGGRSRRGLARGARPRAAGGLRRRVPEATRTRWASETFGPTSVVVTYTDDDQLRQLLGTIEPSLTVRCTARRRTCHRCVS